jgi:hypothetical protein
MPQEPRHPPGTSKFSLGRDHTAFGIMSLSVSQIPQIVRDPMDLRALSKAYSLASPVRLLRVCRPHPNGVIFLPPVQFHGFRLADRGTQTSEKVATGDVILAPRSLRTCLETGQVQPCSDSRRFLPTRSVARIPTSGYDNQLLLCCLLYGVHLRRCLRLVPSRLPESDDHRRRIISLLSSGSRTNIHTTA